MRPSSLQPSSDAVRAPRLSPEPPASVGFVAAFALRSSSREARAARRAGPSGARLTGQHSGRAPGHAPSEHPRRR